MSAPTGVSFMNCHKPKQNCNANKTLCKIISILLVDMLHPLIARSVQFANGSLPPPWITECANLSPLLNSLHHFSFNQVTIFFFLLLFCEHNFRCFFQSWYTSHPTPVQSCWIPYDAIFFHCRSQIIYYPCTGCLVSEVRFYANALRLSSAFTLGGKAKMSSGCETWNP